MRDKRSTDERAKTSGIKIEKNWPRMEPCGSPQVRGDEGELCGGIPTVDVQNERYEVNHCSETEECQTRWKDAGVGWSDREYQRQLIDQEDKGRRLVAWRWH